MTPEIITVQHLCDIPKVPAAFGYNFTTIEDVIARHQKRFGVPPQQIYIFNKMAFVLLPLQVTK